MNSQQEYYDPEMEASGTGTGMVLKPRPFKPLKNTKTNNFFSYSFAVAERNKSANNDSDIEWVYGPNVPAQIMDKITAVKNLHMEAVALHKEMKLAVKDEDKRAQRQIAKEITAKMAEIDEVIYPEDERIYVESKEHKRFRMEQQNEMKLDAASIAALRGLPHAEVGSTAEASLAQAKLEIALKKIAELEQKNAPPVQPEKETQLGLQPTKLNTEPVEATEEVNPWASE